MNIPVTRRKLIQTLAVPVTGALVGAAPSTLCPFVDGLSVISGNSDLTLLPQSGLSGVILDVSRANLVVRADGIQIFPRTYKETLDNANSIRGWLNDHSSVALLATKGGDIKKAHRDRQTAIFFQTQGCDWLEPDMDRLNVMYDSGLRVLQITHNHSNAFGGAGTEKVWTGLTSRGQELIRRMNATNIIPDVSHSSHLTALDVLRVSKRPVTLSHGAARAIVNNARCTPDEVIRGIAASGGVMGIFMMSVWLTSDAEPTSEALVRQIRHVAKVGGIDTVGIANDYAIDGQHAVTQMGNDKAVAGYRAWWNQYADIGVLGFDHQPEHLAIPEFNNVRRMFAIYSVLEKSGFSARETEKIMGGNWIRFLTDSLG